MSDHPERRVRIHLSNPEIMNPSQRGWNSNQEQEGEDKQVRTNREMLLIFDYT